MRVQAALTIATALAIGTTCAQAADEPNREQGAHQHGHGTFEMAIEKTTVTIELRAPGNDIVGFEHAASSDADKAAIESAKKKLADALVLFGFPAEAGCKIQDADIHVHGADADEKHDHGASKPEDTVSGAQQAEKHDHAHDHADGHTNFHAKYTLACAKPGAITGLAFKFFEAFPGSQELDIAAISEKAQVKAEATRATPTVSLRGLW